ncbi:Hypothetical protein A7982_11542 [Minicystis rosea]|nr:Hypothetical protein A7982_11542 [Minicystis rosea]
MRSTIRTTAMLAMGALGVALGPSKARADEPPAAAPAGVTGPGCVLKGTFPGPKGTTIYDAPAGGRAVASFTGAMQALMLSDFQADPTVGRARVATSVGGGALRIEGWVAPGPIAVFAARDLAIAPGHVWIAEAHRVRLVQAASGSLTAEITVPGSSGQTARATAPCDAFALAPGTPEPVWVPSDGRGFLTRGAALELFDAPGGAVVFMLRGAEGTAQLFWSNEARAGFVRVRGRGALVVDAWARQRDLEPLKKGEMMDQFAAPTTTYAGAALSLDGAPRVVKATRDIVVRARREEKDKPIGVIESGAEIYVLETLLGWTNVLPKNLGLSPADDGGFWIPAAEVPK